MSSSPTTTAAAGARQVERSRPRGRATRCPRSEALQIPYKAALRLVREQRIRAKWTGRQYVVPQLLSRGTSPAAGRDDDRVDSRPDPLDDADVATTGQVRAYEVLAARESPWWILTVPELGVVTQARYWGEAELMARDLIAVWLDVPIDTIAVAITKSSEPAGPPASPWMHLKVWTDAAWCRLRGR